MRTAAAKVGALLGEQFGLRGGFSVDGVLGADGFLPTELNPRFSGGLGMLARGLPELPLLLAQMAAASGRDLGVSAAELEDLIVTSADSSRYGVAQTVSTAVESTATETVDVTGDPGGLVVAADGDPVVGSVDLGPANWGSLVRFRPTALDTGDRLAGQRRRRLPVRRRSVGDRVRSAGGRPGGPPLTAEGSAGTYPTDPSRGGRRQSTRA